MSLHLITAPLPGIFYLLTAVSVCGFEEIFLELHMYTCLLVSKVSFCIYVTARLFSRSFREKTKAMRCQNGGKFERLKIYFTDVLVVMCAFN